MYIMWGNIKRTQNPCFFSLGLMNHWDGTNQSWCHGSLTGSDHWISSQFVNIMVLSGFTSAGDWKILILIDLVVEWREASNQWEKDLSMLRDDLEIIFWTL